MVLQLFGCCINLWISIDTFDCSCRGFGRQITILATRFKINSSDMFPPSSDEFTEHYNGRHDSGVRSVKIGVINHKSDFFFSIGAYWLRSRVKWHVLKHHKPRNLSFSQIAWLPRKLRDEVLVEFLN